MESSVMPHFVLQTPSLQRLAAVKIVTCLWNQPDIITRIATSFHGLPHDKTIEYTTQWQVIERKVVSKAAAPSLPEPCKKELFDVIKPIGREIVAWCQYHNLDSYPLKFLDKLVPLQFVWTMHGTIEYNKMTELIMRDERVDVERRFEFACLNCLEDEARQLIELIPNHRIQKYISEAVCYESLDHRILVAYFACTLSGDEDLLHRLFQAVEVGIESINQYIFNIVIYRGSRETCEYFFRKVSQEEKVQFIDWWEMLEDRDQQSPNCGTMFYLSRVNEELFGECSANVLECLLRWPLQSLFMEAAQREWQLMGDSDCAEVLDSVIVKIVEGYKDYDYAQWFKELWRLTPPEHKQHFVSEIDHLEDLFASKRGEFIQLCLNRAPSLQLKALVANEVLYDNICRVLCDESVISDAALVECKQTAALNSSNDQDNEEKRLRSECVSQLVNVAMESRIKSRETAGMAQLRD